MAKDAAAPLSRKRATFFAALYSDQKTKKHKTYTDGTACWHPGSRRITLKDENDRVLESFAAREEAVFVGAELESSRYFVQLDELLPQGTTENPAFEAYYGRARVATEANISLLPDDEEGFGLKRRRIGLSSHAAGNGNDAEGKEEPDENGNNSRDDDDDDDDGDDRGNTRLKAHAFYRTADTAWGGGGDGGGARSNMRRPTLRLSPPKARPRKPTRTEFQNAAAAAVEAAEAESEGEDLRPEDDPAVADGGEKRQRRRQSAGGARAGGAKQQQQRRRGRGKAAQHEQEHFERPAGPPPPGLATEFLRLRERASQSQPQAAPESAYVDYSQMIEIPEPVPFNELRESVAKLKERLGHRGPSKAAQAAAHQVPSIFDEPDDTSAAAAPKAARVIETDSEDDEAAAAAVLRRPVAAVAKRITPTKAPTPQKVRGLSKPPTPQRPPQRTAAAVQPGGRASKYAKFLPEMSDSEKE